MQSVSKTFVAPRGTLRHSGDYKIGVTHLYSLLMQMLLLAFLKNFQANPKLTIIEKRSLEMFINQARTLLCDKWKFIIQHLKDQVLLDSLSSMVPFPTMLGFNTLVKALQDIAEIHYCKMGVPLNTIFECDTIVDAVKLHFDKNEVFMDIFVTHVWVFFRTDLKVANQMARMTEKLSSLPAKTVSSYAAIVARTAVTFSEIPSLVAQALVPDSQPSDPLLVSEPVSIVRVLPDPPPRDDATELILAGVESVLADCVADAVTKAANSFAVGNHSTVMAITGADLDAQVLATSVTSVANAQALEAVTTASAALEVAEAVKDAANAGESVQCDMPSSTEAARLFLEIANKSPPQFHANGSSGPLLVIPEEEDGADQSGTSPLLLDGERRAPFTTSAQSPPPQGVEDGALGAHPLLLADSLESANAPKSPLSNLGSNFASGQSGTYPTHDESLLLAASMPSSSKSSSNPAATISDVGSNPVLEFPNLLAMLEVPPPLHSRSSPMGGDIGGVGAHSSGIPNGNPPGNAQSNVGVRRNPHADLPSSASQGKVGGPQVQVLAQSGDPPGNSGGADHPKTPLSSKLGSDSSTVGTSLSASLPPPNLFGTNGKPVRPLPPTPVPKGTDIGGSPPVVHSSDKSFGSATHPALSPQYCPSGHDIGGSPPAHSPGDPLGFVPPSAPSSSSKLGSAATPALSFPVCPLGHDIGGMKRSGKMLDLSMVFLRGAHLRHLGVPLAQAPLFSHIPPALLAQAVEVA
jgi:hypothetical protein